MLTNPLFIIMDRDHVVAEELDYKASSNSVYLPYVLTRCVYLLMYRKKHPIVHEKLQ